MLNTSSNTLENVTSSSSDYQEQEPLYVSISDFTGNETIYKEYGTAYINQN